MEAINGFNTTFGTKKINYLSLVNRPIEVLTHTIMASDWEEIDEFFCATIENINIKSSDFIIYDIILTLEPSKAAEEQYDFSKIFKMEQYDGCLIFKNRTKPGGPLKLKLLVVHMNG